MRPFLAALALVLAVLTQGPGVPAAFAGELIQSFIQTVKVGRDDRLDVTEEITVDAEGSRIKRGIYRDFPTVFLDENDVRRQVGFSISGITKNGEEEPYSIVRNGDGVRIYIGDEDVLLDPGRYTYVISYTTTRQLRRFADHDELFWNVTGNDWDFPIMRAEATVILPEGVPILKAYGYTGTYGQRGKDLTVDVDRPAGRAVFRTTRYLESRYGLSVVVEMPAGTVLPPSGLDKLRNLYLDNQSSAFLGGGVIAVLAYYLFAWVRVGRDPEKGTVVPLFEPPEGMSAPLAQYVYEHGLVGGGWTALSAALVSLAVKGLIKLGGGDGSDLVITRTAMLSPTLPRSEQSLLGWITQRGGHVVVNKHIGKEVLTLQSAFRSAVNTEKRESYFDLNIGWIIVGLLISIASVVIMFIFSATAEKDFPAALPLVLAVIAGGILWRGAAKFPRAYGFRGVLFSVVPMVFGAIGIVAAGLIMWMITVATGASPVFVALAALLLLVNIAFVLLLPAATVTGRKLMDDIEGLLLYMTVAEEKRLNMAGAPPVTPSKFETLLPYAIALGVEKPWSAALESHLAKAALVAGAAYQPLWYNGRFDRNVSHFTSSLSSMSSSFQSSVPAPKSSSSGRSGGSGGGGGGGGGGGW